MSDCSSYGAYLNCANCDGTPAVHSACTACVNHGRRANCTCMSEPYEMSVKLIAILKMIVQIMSCDKCVSHTSLDTDCARCKSPIFTYHILYELYR